jgi:bifunctional DNase/RNase
MNINSIMEKLHLNTIFKKINRNEKNKFKLQIKDFDEDSEVVTMDKIGITEFGQGVVILKTADGREFPISAFSPETAKNISDFRDGKRSEMPSIYHMFEQICEYSGLLLVKVRIYSSGEALRANLYFTGKKELILRNYRASDAIALASFYSIPILIKKNLLEYNPQIK